MNSNTKLNNNFLPITRDEINARLWDNADVIIVSGDAYIDHPSFAPALIGRLIESFGLKTAINPQPNWRDDLRDFKKLGTPNLFFGVTSGSMDSMVNHYTALKRLRSNDAYTPSGKAGFRPDYATTVYSKILKELFPDVPVIIGGIEASMRRLAHYDYWADTVFPSILIDSKADLIVYGMGEKPIAEIVKQLKNGVKICDIKNVPQTVYYSTHFEDKNAIFLPSFEECKSSKTAYAEAFRLFEIESNKIKASLIVQPHGEGFVIVNPPYNQMTTQEIDSIYDLPFMRKPHPKYFKRGAIPAWDMIKNSVNIHRGCFGGCSFCAIAAHQGKQIVSRSEESILNEINEITQNDDFNGHITDLGGPSANMYKMEGIDKNKCLKCSRPSCIFPAKCNNLNTNHFPLINLYKKARNIDKIKHLTIGSGVRYDMLLSKNKQETLQNGYLEYTENLIKYHVSGRLKVAPEHTSDEVLNIMRKPSFLHFKMFKQLFEQINRKFNLNQQLIPYFISSHPASTNHSMANLAKETALLGYRLEQIQDFTPTPMTLSTTIYYCGFDPYSKKKVYSAKTKSDKQAQQTFFFWYKPENKTWIIKELYKLKCADIANVFYKNIKKR